MIAKLLLTMAVWGPAALGQQQPTTPLAADPLGTRYSASTDVSHISFNSPLVTYGAALNEIQLPAAPIQPANLKQLPQNLEGAQQDTGVQDRQVPVTTSANQQQQQQQYISVQQFPASPQLQNNDQQLQRYAQQRLPLAQAQQQYLPQQQYPVAQPQQQYFSQQQQYPLVPQYLQQQQYPVLQPQQQYVAQQLQAGHLQRLQSSAAGGYFATGPYAAPHSQPGNFLAGQVVPQPLLPQASFAPQLTSRVAFNGPTAGFSYSF